MGLARDSGVENDEMPVKPRGDGGFMPLLIASFNRPAIEAVADGASNAFEPSSSPQKIRVIRNQCPNSNSHSKRRSD